VKLIKPERVFLSKHPEIKEVWLQNQIAADPSILGLGDLILKDKERIQPKAGRLDLLLQDSSNRRYEVEMSIRKNRRSTYYQNYRILGYRAKTVSSI